MTCPFCNDTGRVVWTGYDAFRPMDPACDRAPHGHLPGRPCTCAKARYVEPQVVMDNAGFAPKALASAILEYALLFLLAALATPFAIFFWIKDHVSHRR